MLTPQAVQLKNITLLLLLLQLLLFDLQVQPAAVVALLAAAVVSMAVALCSCSSTSVATATAAATAVADAAAAVAAAVAAVLHKLVGLDAHLVVSSTCNVSDPSVCLVTTLVIDSQEAHMHTTASEHAHHELSLHSKKCQQYMIIKSNIVSVSRML
jgi:hypothetical protein